VSLALRSEPLVLDVAGRRVRCAVTGAPAGEPVVLVHGLSASSRWWRKTLPALTTRHRCYLVDLPGFGAMRRPLSRYALSAAPEWLAALMDALSLERAHVMGHSMGGYVSVRLAVERPDLVDRLVLVAPAGVPTRRSVVRYARPLLATAWTAPPRFYPLVVPDALRTGPWTLWQAARQLLREDVRPHLERISAPTLLVWGDRDYLVPPKHGPLLREAIPDARLLLLPGAGHVPMEDRPEAFNAAVAAFLRGEPVGH
jgi:pimeloyl-ACP methyl ester carboxylesterase